MLERDVVWEGPEQTVRLTNRGALDLRRVFQIDHQNHHDDTLLHALDGAWSLIFSGTLESDLLPIPLTLATPSMTQPLLGDFVAFAVSYAASPSCGSGRMLALAVQILSQLGEYMSNMVNLKPALTVCLKNDLPLVRPIQRKQEKPEADIPPADPNHEPNTKMPDYKLLCLANISDAFCFVNRAESKSLAVIHDSADISSADTTLFFADSPVLDAGWLLPHQVPPPCALCWLLTVCITAIMQLPIMSHFVLSIVNRPIHFLSHFILIRPEPVPDLPGVILPGVSNIQVCQTFVCARPHGFHN